MKILNFYDVVRIAVVSLVLTALTTLTAVTAVTAVTTLNALTALIILTNNIFRTDGSDFVFKIIPKEVSGLEILISI